MTPNRFSAPVLACQKLTRNSFELLLKRPEGFTFDSGQYIRIYHESLERDYTLASGPAEPELRLVIRAFPGGRVSTYLSTVGTGEPIRFYGPMGYFVFRGSERTPVFIATGTGVAPFVAMSRAGIKGYVFLHGAKDPVSLLYRADLEKNAARYVPCLSEQTAGDAFSGRVTDYLNHMDAAQDYDFYLCGHQEMIRDAFQIIDERFSGARIHSEVFY